MTTCAEVLGRHGLARNAECLQAHSIYKCTHVLECSIIDLMELGNLTHDQALLTRDAAAAAVAPPLITFNALLQQQSARQKLALGIPAVDDALQGGLLNGSITELVGPASALALPAPWPTHVKLRHAADAVRALCDVCERSVGSR